MSDVTRTVIAAGTGSLAAIPATPLLRIMGVSITETAGAITTTAVSLQEGVGTDLTKEILAITLAANEAKTIWLGESGVPCVGGLWINRISGTTRVVIHSRVSDRGKDSFDAPGW